MQVDHHLDEIEPDAGADDARNIAAAMIALEQPIEIAGGNADAVIGDGDDNFVGDNFGVTSMAPPSGEYLTALARRLLKTWNNSFASPTIGIGVAANRSVICEPGTISRCNWQTSCSKRAASISAGMKIEFRRRRRSAARN